MDTLSLTAQEHRNEPIFEVRLVFQTILINALLDVAIKMAQAQGYTSPNSAGYCFPKAYVFFGDKIAYVPPTLTPDSFEIEDFDYVDPDKPDCGDTCEHLHTEEVEEGLIGFGGGGIYDTRHTVIYCLDCHKKIKKEK